MIDTEKQDALKKIKSLYGILVESRESVIDNNIKEEEELREQEKEFFNCLNKLIS